jgi:hypothetical protein
MKIKSKGNRIRIPFACDPLRANRDISQRRIDLIKRCDEWLILGAENSRRAGAIATRKTLM